MSKKRSFAASLVLLVLAGIYGCESSETETEVSTPTATETEASPSDHDHGDADHEHADGGHEHAEGDHEHADTAEMSDMEKMNETLAKLPPEDRESAMKQHFCPVSGKMLGTMGMPEKIEVEGQTVWICCEGCEQQVRAEPEKYLAKINQ